MTARRTKPPLTRRQVVRRVLLWCSPVAIVVAFVFGIFMIGAAAGFSTGMKAYEAQDWDAARDAFTDVRGNPVERWKGYYNSGTARLRDPSDWSSYLAVDELDTALETVPEDYRCVVQNNRAIALEAYGDDSVADAEETLAGADALAEAEAAREAGEPYDESVFEPPYEGADEPTSAEEYDWARYLMQDARDAYADAAEAALDPACESQSSDPTPEPSAPPSSGGGGGGEDDEQEQPQQDEGSQQQQTAERNQDKMAQADERAQEIQRQLDGDDEPAPAPQTEEERQQEIADRNKEAGGGGGTGGDEPGGEGGDQDGSGGDGGDLPGGPRSGW